jgi:hypothetical protein
MCFDGQNGRLRASEDLAQFQNIFYSTCVTVHLRTEFKILVDNGMFNKFTLLALILSVARNLLRSLACKIMYMYKKT